MGFSQQGIDQLRRYQSVLEQRLAQVPPSQQQFLMEMGEELHVAVEQLETANQELSAANAQIDRERRRYRDLFEFAPDSYLTTNQQGCILEANYAATRMFAVRQEFLQGKPLAIFVAGAERTHFRDHLYQLQQLSQNREWILQGQEWTLQMKPRNGQPFHASIHVTPLWDVQAQKLTFRWLIRNITRQIQAEQELRRALQFEKTLRSITQHIQSSFDEAQILQTAVRELSQVLGLLGCNVGLYDLEQRTSTILFEDAVAIPSAENWVIQMERFPAGYGQLLQGECFQFCPLSTPEHPALRELVAVLACPILDGTRPLGDLWLFRPQDSYFDAIEIPFVHQVANQCAIAIRQARLYQAAQQQVETMERLNRLKDDFLSTVSHELRTPITNILMALRLLDRTTEPERRQRYMDILRMECDREVGLINNLLDLQRLEAESYHTYLTEALDLQEWLPRLVDPWNLRMQERQQQLELRLPETSVSMLTDRASLDQILAELLRNAHKYTPVGGKVVVAVVSPDVLAPLQEPTMSLPVFQDSVTQVKTAITFVIANTAEIAPDQLPLIFNKFYRIPSALPWYQEGTGLGLTLVKRLVELMQGTLQVESQDGWTTFSLRLPLYDNRFRPLISQEG